MTPGEQQEIHSDYSAIKKMVASIIVLLVATLIGGFTTMYHFNARVSVIESKLNEGPRFTMHNFQQFYTEYEERKARTDARLDSLEKISSQAIDRMARMDEKLGFLVEMAKKRAD